MYFHDPSEAATNSIAPSPGIQLALWSSALATLGLGIFPSLLLDFSTQGAILAR